LAIELGEQEQPCIIIITGVMASGKSTVAQYLAERIEKAVHLRGDIFRKMIVTGQEPFLPNPSAEATRQLKLRYQISASVADQYVQAGFNVVLQDVIVGPMLKELVEMIESRPIYVIVLSPDEETIADREAARGKTGYGIWTVADLNEILQKDTPKMGMWLDNSTWTPEETVEEILAKMKAEARVKGFNH
jgi:predicted kinase